MAEIKLDLILHPIRLRIITTIGTQRMTSQQIARALPDVSQATLYRHINALYEGGVLTVVAENPIRGTVEKVFALDKEQSLALTPEDLAIASKEDHMRYFTTFTVTLIQQFAQYLQMTETVDLQADGIGYHTTPLYMTDEELQQFGKDLFDLMQPFLEAKDNHERKSRLFSTVFMPSGKPDAQDE